LSARRSGRASSIADPHSLRRITMKLIVSTAVALVLAGQAFAGALVFEAPEEPVVVAEPAPMGGSNAAWIIPVLGLAAIAYAISNDDDDDDGTPGEED
jgi:hypothetical protein